MRLSRIENDIQKTYGFYLKMLTERRDALLNEFHAVVAQLLIRGSHDLNATNGKTTTGKATIKALSGDSANLVNSQNNDLAASSNVETKSERLLDDTVEQLGSPSSKSTSPSCLDRCAPTSGSVGGSESDKAYELGSHLMPIEFVYNLSAIQNSIRNTFGFIR